MDENQLRVSDIEDEQVKDIVSFIKLNSPEDLMERIKIQKTLGVQQGVYFPSILGILANETIGKIQITLIYNGKKFQVIAEGVDEENLAVLYSNRLIGEMIEAGVVSKLEISIRDGIVYSFENNNNFYHPVESSTNDVYPTILAPFYKKEILDENIFE